MYDRLNNVSNYWEDCRVVTQHDVPTDSYLKIL